MEDDTFDINKKASGMDTVLHEVETKEVGEQCQED